MLLEGEIAVVKTSGELVFVIEIREDTTVMVSRPILSKADGIRHQDEEFNAAELESIDDHFRREATETLRKRKIMEEVFGEGTPRNKASDVTVN